MQALNWPDANRIANLVKSRPGESKVGQSIKIAEPEKSFQQYHCRFALLGIPEDIGPRANLGQGGARDAWSAFLTYFLNLQANDFFPADDILLLGEVNCDDLHDPAPDISSLRDACAALDARVSAVLEAVFKANLIPVVIGGGHNNAFPIIKACSVSREFPLAVCNLDPHSDFRAMEGRHSGNPFRYAQESNYLTHYAVLGLHEQKNNQDSLQAMQDLGFPWFSIQQTHWSKTHNYDQCLEQVGKYLLETGLPVGVELDLDAITNMPSSAMTAAGVALGDALYYVDQMAALPQIQYLHLAEGAPTRHANGAEEGARIVGQSLAELCSTFVKSIRRGLNPV